MGIVTYLTVLLCTTMRHEQNMALVEAVKFQTFHKLYETIPFEEVPLDVTLVRFINTSLRDITFFPPFDSLSELVLQRQPHIKIFPNFENISSSLTILEITDCSLTHIDPSRLQILVNLEKLDLSTNRLTTPFPDMDRTRGCAINILRLYNNLLHSFPYLPVIGQTLQTLVIKGNFNITMVSKETLSVYTKLETLNNNPGGFRKFPDLQLLAAVHQAPRLNIDLQNNVITSIDANDISPVVAKNWTVHLMSNPIKHVGNMLHIGSGRPPIALYGTPVPCDCGLRWLKAAGDRKTAILAGSVQCDGSGSLGGNLQDLHYDDLVCDDPIRRSRVEGFSTDSVTVPPVMKILDARSLLNCASRCVQDSKCLIFAYNRHRGNGRCGLTDADDLASGNTGPPPGDWSGNGISWFVVDA